MFHVILSTTLLRNSVVFGGVAQLGERLNGIQEVIGSIPTVSTNEKRTASAVLFSLVETTPFAGGKGRPRREAPGVY